jgi:hypothetical protein
MRSSARFSPTRSSRSLPVDLAIWAYAARLLWGGLRLGRRALLRKLPKPAERAPHRPASTAADFWGEFRPARHTRFLLMDVDLVITIIFCSQVVVIAVGAALVLVARDVHRTSEAENAHSP